MAVKMTKIGDSMYQLSHISRLKFIQTKPKIILEIELMNGRQTREEIYDETVLDELGDFFNCRIKWFSSFKIEEEVPPARPQVRG